MNYSFCKILQNFSLVSTSLSVFTILGTTTLSLLMTQSAQAAQVTFNFQNDTWDHGGFTSTGWTNFETTGTATKNGLSLTMTSSFSTIDPNGSTQNNHSGNLSEIAGSTFSGFLMGNRNDFDLVTGGSLNGYQRWDFQFSEAVNLADVRITDIDSDGTAFVDAVAIEGFTSATPGTIGTGIDPTLNNLGSHLLNDTIGITSSSETIVYVSDDVSQGVGNVNTDELNNTAFISFSDPVNSFSLYLFNNRTTTTGGEHGVGIGTETFEISVDQASASVPFEFSPGLGLLLSGGGLLGMRFLKRRQAIKLDVAQN